PCRGGPPDLLIARRYGTRIQLLPSIQQPQPRGCGVQFQLGAVLQNSDTPTLRVAGTEDEDDDEDENEALP
ncbi:MAG: hypothetical protein WAM44_09630, partial [Chthoniobacterales bacterium]